MSASQVNILKAPIAANDSPEVLNRRAARKWTSIVLGLLGTMIVVDSYIAYLAVHTGTAMVEDHPYERGLQYNQVLTALNAGSTTNLVPQVSVRPAPKGMSQLTVRFVPTDTPDHAESTELSQVSMIARHAAGSAAEDQNLQLTSSGPLEFSSQADFSRNGRWDAEITARRGTDTVKWRTQFALE